MPERTDSVEELVSPDIRQTIPSWKWYTSLRSTHGSSWARATRLDYSDYDEDRRSKRSKRKGGKRRGVKWAPLTVVPWMRPAFPDAVKKPKTAQKRLRTAVAKPPKLPKTPSPRRPRTVKEQLCCVSDGARDVVRVTVDDVTTPGSPSSVTSPRALGDAASPRHLEFPALDASPEYRGASASTASVPRTASDVGSPLSPRRFQPQHDAFASPRPPPLAPTPPPKRDEDKFAVYAKTWPPKRAAYYKSKKLRNPFGHDANKFSNRSSILCAGNVTVSEYASVTTNGKNRMTLKTVGKNSFPEDFRHLDPNAPAY